MTLPLTYSAVARAARQSLERALEDGHTRLQVEIQTFRKTAAALATPLLPPLEGSVAAIFGTGNAGLGQIEWGEGPWTLLDSGIAMEYLDRIRWATMLVIDASSVEAGPMGTLWRVAGAKPIVMVNGWPEAPGVIGVGRGLETERTALREKLLVSFYIQAQRFQPVVIYRAYPGPWQLWSVVATPRLIHEQDQPFSPESFKRLTTKEPGVSLTEAAQAFWQGPRYFRVWEQD